MYLVGKGYGEILKKDGECIVRIPKEVAEDTMFPFNDGEEVKVSFEVNSPRLLVERAEP